MLNDNKPSQQWQAWFIDIFNSINNSRALSNDPVTINPDFHWSRTKGNTPTTTDGSFVEQWNVKGGGMTYVITPTNYSSTSSGAGTGSARYAHVSITTVNGNEFSIYQSLPNRLSKLQGKNVTISSSIKNNLPSSVKCYFYIGFDLTGGGTDSYSGKSKVIYLSNGDNNINATISCPDIGVDNQTNIVTAAIKFYDLSGPVNLDIFYVKPEVSDSPTALHVDHSLEKYKIDNPP